MIMHMKKTTIFWGIFISLALNWFVLFVAPGVNLAAKILFPLGGLLLVSFVFTNSLRIDARGVWGLFAFFQKELWVYRLINWENIESVDFVETPKSFTKNMVWIVPKNTKVTLWSTNMIGASIWFFDFEKIAPLLLEHGVTLPQDLLLKLKIQP